MVKLLPSTDFTNQLSAQIDKCHAMAIEILAENYDTAINAPDNNTDKGRRRNRRVDFMLLGD